MKNLINLEPNYFSVEQKKILIRKFNYNEVNKTRSDIKKIINNYEIIITRLKYQFDENFLRYAKKLEVIVTFTTGLTHLDLKEIKKRNIKIISLKNENRFLENIHSSSEFAFLMMLSINRNFYPSILEVKNKKKWNRDLYIGKDLFAQTIGILGYGRIGKKIKKYATAFGMKIKIYDKYNNNIPKKFKQKSIRDLFTNSNIVVIAINYDDANKHIINKNNLKYLNKDACLVNISRGEIINETDLLRFLKNKLIKAVALDVLENENNINYKSNKLIEYSSKNNNLIISPHIAGATFDSFKKTQEFLINKLIKYYNE